MDDSAVVPLDDIQVNDRLNYIERPVAILDQKASGDSRSEGENLEEQGCAVSEWCGGCTVMGESGHGSHRRR